MIPLQPHPKEMTMANIRQRELRQRRKRRKERLKAKVREAKEQSKPRKK
jgi:hypothetical protein